MKVIVDKVKLQRTYPCLLTSTRTGAIVLFVEEDCGTVIDAGSGRHAVGHYSPDWDMTVFEKAPCTVTLTEE